jgi:hypothetical protein
VARDVGMARRTTMGTCLRSDPERGLVLARLMPSLDHAAFRLTGHRHTLTALMTGLPVVVLTNTGARTGAARTEPVLGFPVIERTARHLSRHRSCSLARRETSCR